MKKAAVATSLLASSLLLTGCDIPGSVEELTHWRERFFVEVDPERLRAWIDNPAFSLLDWIALLGFGIALMGLLSNMYRRRDLWGGNYGVGMGIMSSIVVLMMHFRITTSLGRQTFPPDLNSDHLLEVLQLSLSPDISQIVLAAWTVNLVFAIPVVHALWQLVMLPMNIGSVFESITSRNWHGIYTMLGNLAGWLLLPWVLYLSVELVGEIPPLWFSELRWLLNGSFLLWMMFLWWMCYWVIPRKVERRVYDSVLRIEVGDLPPMSEDSEGSGVSKANLLWGIPAYMAYAWWQEKRSGSPGSHTDAYDESEEPYHPFWTVPPESLPPGPTNGKPGRGGGPGSSGAQASTDEAVVEGEFSESPPNEDLEDTGTTEETPPSNESNTPTRRKPSTTDPLDPDPDFPETPYESEDDDIPDY